MSREHFDDNCPGCRPAMLDVKTGLVLPDDHPLMKAVLGIWAETTVEERRAYHAVCVNNSRDPEHLKIYLPLVERMKAAIEVDGQKPN